MKKKFSCSPVKKKQMQMGEKTCQRIKKPVRLGAAQAGATDMSKVYLVISEGRTGIAPA